MYGCMDVWMYVCMDVYVDVCSDPHSDAQRSYWGHEHVNGCNKQWYIGSVIAELGELPYFSHSLSLMVNCQAVELSVGYGDP